MNTDEELVPVYGPPALEVCCLDGDRIQKAGLISSRTLEGAYSSARPKSFLKKINEKRRADRLFNDAKRDGIPLDDYFCFTPFLWTALLAMCVTRGVADVDVGRGAVVTTRDEWTEYVKDFVDTAEDKPSPEELDEIIKQAKESFHEGASVFDDETPADPILTLFIWWT